MRAGRVSRVVNTGFALAVLASLAWPGDSALAGGAGDGAVRCTDDRTALTEDGSPSILGSSVLGADDIVGWWHRSGRMQPEQLTAPIDEVLTAYIDIGEAEGVRGDWALAQAILETGWFRSADTAINNFAGIGHSEDRQDRENGYPYPDAATGVRAHIQLLKRFAAGNGVTLALAEAAPLARASATTWGQLAGTWASSTDYWTTLGKVYQRLHRGACPA